MVKAGFTLITAVAAVAASVPVSPLAAASPTIPAMPDLSGYTTVPGLTDDSGTHFRTADGLRCTMKEETIDCIGNIPGTGVEANAISIGNTVSSAGAGYGGSIPGVRLIADPGAPPTDKNGDAAPTLRAGSKVVGPGSQCAVAATDAGQRTMCTVGHPSKQWLVVAPSGSGVGPATSGLPAGYPEPLASVQGYVGTANVRFPSFFTVDGAAGELRCEMGFSSVTPHLGCDGDLPGTDANEVFFDQSGVAKVVHTDTPQFTGPSNGSPPRLPVGYRTPYPGTCLAITGGVACYDGPGGPGSLPLHGFKVDAASVTTF